MSADNWTVCPRCQARRNRELRDMDQEIAESYRQVPLDEYMQMQAERDVMREETLLRTFREDYEFYGADEGTVTVDYSGSCQKCGLETHFDHEHKIEGVDDDATE